jgi:hypothetical protein
MAEVLLHPCGVLDIDSTLPHLMRPSQDCRASAISRSGSDAATLHAALVRHRPGPPLDALVPFGCLISTIMKERRAWGTCILQFIGLVVQYGSRGIVRVHTVVIVPHSFPAAAEHQVQYLYQRPQTANCSVCTVPYGMPRMLYCTDTGKIPGQDCLVQPRPNETIVHHERYQTTHLGRPRGCARCVVTSERRTSSMRGRIRYGRGCTVPYSTAPYSSGPDDASPFP